MKRMSLLLILCGFLMGCGQSGALYLPEAPQKNVGATHE